MRVITAPGVEIKEIDKSQYSPAMTGTNCFIAGFTDKGESYQPMEFTSRAALINYYGEPSNEAEKYFYNACTEVLNQNGKLYCSRLPYDNEAADKMVGFKYNVTGPYDINIIPAQFNINKYSFEEDLSVADSTIKKVSIIESTELPICFSLDKIDEYRTDELKVPVNTFLIVDKTCSTYKKILEDTRKGKDREMLGIVPVVTTAANALYAQKLINVDRINAKYYESIGNIYTQDEDIYLHGGGVYNDILPGPNPDFVKQLNSSFKNYGYTMSGAKESYNSLGEIKDGINNIINGNLYTLLDMLADISDNDIVLNLISTHNELIDQLYNEWINLSVFTNTELSVKLTELAGLSIDINNLSAITIGNFRDNAEQLYYMYNSYVKLSAYDDDIQLPSTVSFDANEYFIPLEYDVENNMFKRDSLKNIGIVIFKSYIDASEGNKIAFEPVEAFCGSLNKDDKDINTGVTTFIDTIINSNSNYIYFFSNCYNSSASKKLYAEIDIHIAKPTDTASSLGFFEDQTKKVMSVSKSIQDGLNKCFEKVSDINERDIDIACDAGVSNIASFIKSVYGDDIGAYDLNAVDSANNPLISYWKCSSTSDVGLKTWKAIVQKYDTFCKKIRKDCMFITECPRPLVLSGQKKIIRPSKPTNTIDANILPYVKFITGLNTNYGAGYMGWFEVADEYTGDFLWLPPSIKALGVYINTDVNFNYWDAPAGLNRGIVQALDVAFSPNGKQAGSIYEKNWNYAINYPQDGIVLEGQKTFQVKPSAFDRVNVRRLFLRLERMVYKVARYFVYEGNTAYTRQRLVDAIDPYFREAKVGGGIYDYRIICDESNNTPEVIDRNELRLSIGIKPVKTVEFIIVQFIALSTGGSFEEAMG